MPRLKLKMSSSKMSDAPPQKIVLRVGNAAQKGSSRTVQTGTNRASQTASRSTSTDKQSRTTGLAIDNDALQRQKRYVQAGIEGSAGSATPNQPKDPVVDQHEVSTSAAAPTSTLALQDTAVNSAPSATPPAALKRAGSTQKSPLPDAARSTTPAPTSSGSDGPTRAMDDAALAMPPPPTIPARRLSGSPHPSPTADHAHHDRVPPTPRNAPTPVDARRRPPGTGKAPLSHAWSDAAADMRQTALTL